MDHLKNWAADWLNLDLDASTLRSFQTYHDLLGEWNQKFNLTALTASREVQAKHFLDSLTCFRALPRQAPCRLIDVGTGAGFPGIPLKIVNPAIQLTLTDAVGKKVDFCQHVVSALSLTDVEVRHARAEDLGQAPDYRGSFDWAVARAVADLPILAEYLLPLVRVGGFALAMKGAAVESELERAEPAIAILGGRIARVEAIALPEDYGQRRLVLLEKIAPTPPRYPRKAGAPAKRPLS